MSNIVHVKAEPENIGKYRVRLLCYDQNAVDPYEESPADDKIFDTKEEAFNYGLSLAEDELEYFQSQDDTDPGISYGIPEDAEYENGSSASVVQYYNPEGDTTGDTNTITTYFVTAA